MFTPGSTQPRHALRHLALAAVVLLAGGAALASSHREAPFITTSPKVDGTDFYMFRSYAPGRDGFVTLIANYQPLQDPYGGPNYFKMDPNALYEIHVDSDGNAVEDLTFQFRFQNTLANSGQGVELTIGDKSVAIPLTQAGQIAAVNAGASNVRETYTVDVVRGGRRAGAGQRMALTNASGGSSTFDKPADNIGQKTIPDYAAYAAQHIYDVKIPGCADGRLFVGQRQEGFAVNLGPIFDLVNAPVGVILDRPGTANAAAANSIQDKNVTSLALEVPIACLTATGNGVIGGWTTASVRQGRLMSGNPKSGHQTSAVEAGPWTQVSRLGMPLVNEVVIGLRDKDRFNAAKPAGDGQFLTYVTNPTLPALVGIALLGDAAAVAPTNYPRSDLVATFLTGIKGPATATLPTGSLNQMATVTPSEMLRLNTGIAPTAEGSQSTLGVLGNDFAGYPNGRRPKDDVVDISLIAVLGGLCVANGDTDALGFGAACNPAAVPNTPVKDNIFNVHDAVDQSVVPFLGAFPYLNTPNPGAVNP